MGQIESSTYDAITGLLVSQTDISGDVYTYTYDGFGKIKTKSQKSATGNTAMINWAWTNNSPNHSVILRTETMGDGQVMKIWYDALGREIQSSYKNFLGKEVYMVTTYDALGRTTQVSEPYYSGASSIQYHASQYDSFGRISKQITPLGTISYSYSGNQTTINDGTKGYTTIRETDLAGKLKRVTDPGGTITYTYGPSGNPTKIVCGSTTSTMEYDLLGRRTKLIDPNAGTILCSYDGWGNLKKQTDARGQAEEYIYENSGRLQTYKRGTESFSYVYDPTYKNQVKSVIYGGVKTEYGYGTYGRLSSKTETVDSKSFKFSYTYNDKGQLETMTYPNSKSIKYEYVNGDLYKMIWLSSNTTVWQKGNENAKGQLLSSTLGNSIQESYVYNAVGMPTSIQAKKGSSTLLNISYPSIDTHQNIRERKDLYKSLSESFTYDDMNRLTTGVTYSANGNITSKVNVGSYQYDSNHPHAVKSVNFNGAAEFNNSDLLVTYNSVRMPIQLTEGNKVYTLTYNGENTRIKSLYKENNSSVFTKYYSGPYEEIQKGSITQKNYYIYAGGQIAAVYTEGSSDAGMYYFHNDHLGSPWLITNASGNEVQRLNFDAWGRRRDASNWSNYVNLPTFKFDRGFTGHEHLDMFGLINMNARLYDPLLGRFLSPDPIVQAPEFTQSFNGYTYALNNPLAYTDPNGEFFFSALIPGVGVFLDAMCWGATLGAAAGGVKSAVQGQNFWSGAWKGAITGGVGGLMGPIGGAGMSFAANVGLGAAQGALVGSLDAALWGTNVGKGMLWGCISGASFATLTSDNMRNLVKRKGFKSNQSVFKDFAAGKYTAEGGVWQQDALDYFGFEGKYDSKIQSKYYETEKGDYWGVTNSKTGQISYGNNAFKDYDVLKATYYKEIVHANKIVNKQLLKQIPDDIKGIGMDMYLEEIDGYMGLFRNQGLYPKVDFPFSGVNYYQSILNSLGVTTPKYPRFDLIYKIPRRW